MDDNIARDIPGRLAVALLLPTNAVAVGEEFDLSKAFGFAIASLVHPSRRRVPMLRHVVRAHALVAVKAQTQPAALALMLAGPPAVAAVKVARARAAAWHAWAASAQRPRNSSRLASSP